MFDVRACVSSWVRPDTLLKKEKVILESIWENSKNESRQKDHTVENTDFLKAFAKKK